VTRAVFDCVILLQAAGHPTGPAGACLQTVRDGRLELIVSPDVLVEVRDVLTRPKSLRKFPALTLEAVELFLDDVTSHAITLADVPKVFKLARDPKDEPYLNLAIAAGARYLVSRDNDLLDLMRDEGFRRQYPDLAIIDPATLLRELRSVPETGTGEEGKGRVNGAD
jgi:putative PIN family toxin of toxin-antitoxin system